MQALEARERERDMSMELDNVFKAHPDATELDNIKIGDAPDSPSLFEMALFFVHDRNKQPMEAAYQAAKAIHMNIMSTAKKTAMGMVQNKKDSVTESAPTSTKDESVIYVDSPDQVLRAQIKANMAGQKVQVRLRSK